MKTLFVNLFVVLGLVAPQAFAGGSGGGAVLMNAMLTDVPEIVYHLGSSEGKLRFQYARLINNEWQVEQVEVFAEELQDHLPALQAIESSKALKRWVEIRPAEETYY